MADKGKQWEQVFKEQWKKQFPNSFIYRLPDQVSGYKIVSANPCDFFCFNNGLLFMIENKEHKGASLPFSAIRQYDKLSSKEYDNIKGLRRGILLWLSEKDKVFYIPISTIKQLKSKGEKSVGLRHVGNYNIIEIPAKKKRIFMDCDYSILLNTVDGE